MLWDKVKISKKLKEKISLKILLHFIYFVYIGGGCATLSMWMSEDNVQKLVLSYYVGPTDWIHAWQQVPLHTESSCCLRRHFQKKHLMKSFNHDIQRTLKIHK